MEKENLLLTGVRDRKALHIRCHYGPKSTIMNNGNAPGHYFFRNATKAY